jgi:multimeric flavodoxin WrbA
MIDRLVCADGGNPDPTTTHGKNATQGKALELRGWNYPRHLSGRVFSLIVHGDTEGADILRRSLTDRLQDMHLIAASSIDRYIGYYEPYATSHQALDRDHALQTEVRNAAKTLLQAVALARSGKLVQPGDGLTDPRPK